MHKNITKAIISLGLIVMVLSNVYASDAADKAYDSGDYKKAFQLYMQEIDKQDATAQHRLGWMYDNGEGVTQDYAKAQHYYTLTADQGDAQSQNNLGTMYREGLGVTQDYEKAMQYYTLAADQGFNVAQSNLGSMYYFGNGVIQDYAKSVRYHTLAANQGNALSQYNLGLMYAKGEGILQNMTIAHALLNLSVAGGYEEAVDSRSFVANKLSNAQMNQAQVLARDPKKLWALIAQTQKKKK